LRRITTQAKGLSSFGGTNMPPKIPAAKLTLTYPLYACDFDPSDATKLVVGGGGGAGRSGVGNKIVRLIFSNPILERTAS
jgi:hypothetical protein